MPKPKSIKHKPSQPKQKQRVVSRVSVDRSVFISRANLPEVVAELRRHLATNPNPSIRRTLRRNLDYYTGAVTTPSIDDDVVTVKEAPYDIPPLALKGSQIIERRVRIEKLANGGTTAGGFYAELTAADLKVYSTGGFRIKKLISWTAPVNNSTESQFAGLLISGSAGSQGTESLSTWSENWTRIGTGFAGLEASFPLGDFLLFVQSDTTVIATHFTGLGGSGGASGIPVVFDVWLETLI